MRTNIIRVSKELSINEIFCFIDIALEPDKAVKKVEDNLQLSLSDEEAVQHLQSLLDISVSAVMPAVMDFFHRTAQIMRN